MNIIKPLIKKVVRSLNLSGISDPEQWLVDTFGGVRTATGTNITEITALRNTAVYACVRILSESLASVPFLLLRQEQKGKGTSHATDNPWYDILNSVANSEMTAFTLRETMMAHLVSWGNAYAWIERDRYQQPIGLWPLRPDRTWPERDPTTKVLQYKTVLPNGGWITIPKEDMWHIPGLGFDGLKGYSPIGLCREAIGMAQATEEYGARFFSNGARPAGILKHPKTLSEGAQKRLREGFEEKYTGLTNAHKMMILEEDMSYEAIGLPPEDSQFMETRRFQIEEIARIFRVPLHMIGDLEHATFSNIEHQSLEFVKFTLFPWAVRWEQSANFKLLGPIDRKTLLFKHSLAELERGDLKSRYDAYSIAINGGWMFPNEARLTDDLDPLPEELNTLRAPLQSLPADIAKAYWSSKITPKGDTPNA